MGARPAGALVHELLLVKQALWVVCVCVLCVCVCVCCGCVCVGASAGTRTNNTDTDTRTRARALAHGTCTGAVLDRRCRRLVQAGGAIYKDAAKIIIN